MDGRSICKCVEQWKKLRQALNKPQHVEIVAVFVLSNARRYIILGGPKHYFIESNYFFNLKLFPTFPFNKIFLII